MPFCPNCECEYRSGFTACKDCGAALVETRPGREPAAARAHDHHAAAPAAAPPPTATLFPTAALPSAIVATAGGEAADGGFLVEGDKAWIYSAPTGAEAWFLRQLLAQRGLAAGLDYLGAGHPAPFRVLVAADRGAAAMAALDEWLGGWKCPRCGEPGPAPGDDHPFCVHCGLAPERPI